MPSVDATLPDWARAHGTPLLAGWIKHSPGDFRVDEVLGFPPSGDGEHDFLRVEKTGANTAWVARQLADHAGVPARDASYSGLKDRRAVTTQWFSVRRPSGAGTDWAALDLPGVNIIEQTRHRRKLKRGAHEANVFHILVRFEAIDGEKLSERFAILAAHGVPNYFGQQRFGRKGNNLALARDVFSGKRIRRDQRSIAISAARSFIFNEVLSARVSAGTWNQVLEGEPVNLNATGSFFIPEEVDDQLQERLRLFDVHPTGPLWGKGASGTSGVAACLEAEVSRSHPDLIAGLEKVGTRADRRALRMPLHDFGWQLSDGFLEIKFRLGKGCYATSVLREFMTTADE